MTLWKSTLVESLKGLAKVDELTIAADYAKPSHAASAVVGEAEIFVLLEGVIDLAAERKRLRKELGKIGDGLERSRKKLSNQDFLERAKPEVVERERGKLAQYEDARAKIDNALTALED